MFEEVPSSCIGLCIHMTQRHVNLQANGPKTEKPLSKFCQNTASGVLQSGKAALADWDELDLEMTAAVAELSESQAHAERLADDKAAIESELHRLKTGLREAGLDPERYLLPYPVASMPVLSPTAEMPSQEQTRGQSPRSPVRGQHRHLASINLTTLPNSLDKAAAGIKLATAISQANVPTVKPSPSTGAAESCKPSMHVSSSEDVSASKKSLNGGGVENAPSRKPSMSGSRPGATLPSKASLNGSPANNALAKKKCGMNPSQAALPTPVNNAPTASQAREPVTQPLFPLPSLIAKTSGTPVKPLPPTQQSPCALAPPFQVQAAEASPPRAQASALKPVGPLQTSFIQQTSDSCVLSEVCDFKRSH
jgi:hypothetical protein